MFANRAVAGATACKVCPAGQFNPQSTQTECLKCAAGRHLIDPGLTAAQHDRVEWCAQCKIGQFSAAGDQFCAGCVAGKRVYFNTTTQIESCQPCSPGKYRKTSDVAATCKSCPRGFNQEDEGMPFCLPCVPGMFNDEEGLSTGCKLCAVGNFSNATETIACLGKSHTKFHRLMHNGRFILKKT